MPSLTDLLSGSEGSRSLAARARKRRYEMLVDRFPDLGAMRVLDLGGEQHTWIWHRVRPASVVLLNLDWRAEEQRRELAGSEHESWIEALAGDACDPPPEIVGRQFDLVYSNSVIEHVGGYAQRCRFAHYARTLAEHHWIQTPNRYFPLEPHWLFPGFQFLPLRARVAAHRRWPVGTYAQHDGTDAQVTRAVLEIELLSETEMRFLFPESELVRERAAGLTKSLTATR